jgi:hypothetical protein
MTPEERLTKIEQDIEKQNEGIRGLIVVGRTCLDAIKEMGEVQRKDHEEWTAQNRITDEKLNILIDTVDRIIRRRNGKE